MTYLNSAKRGVAQSEDHGSDDEKRQTCAKREENIVKDRFLSTHLIKAGLTAVAVMIVSTSPAFAANYYKTAGNVAVYLGVLPAEMVLGHAPEHPENKMHGGVPSAKRQHHVVVAIFDTKDGSRIGNAAVTTRVAEIGFGSIEKKLELMTIDKAASFGNYFSMGSPGPYRIDIEIRRPGATTPAKTSFEFSHPRR